MTVKAIQYQNGYLFVDEEAKIQNVYPHIVLEKLTTGVYELWQVDNIHDIDEENQYEIIAQSPELSIPDIPYVELEEDADRNKALQDLQGYSRATLTNSYGISPLDGYYIGYKAAQSKKYSEEDLRKIIDMSHTACRRDVPYSSDLENEIIQSLQPKIESIELETEWITDGDEEHDEGGTLSGTVESYQQPVTYQKDGKTFLKVKQINYATG